MIHRCIPALHSRKVPILHSMEEQQDREGGRDIGSKLQCLTLGFIRGESPKTKSVIFSTYICFKVKILDPSFAGNFMTPNESPQHHKI